MSDTLPPDDIKVPSGLPRSVLATMKADIYASRRKGALFHERPFIHQPTGVVLDVARRELWLVTDQGRVAYGEPIAPKVLDRLRTLDTLTFFEASGEQGVEGQQEFKRGFERFFRGGRAHLSVLAAQEVPLRVEGSGERWHDESAR